MHNLMDAIWANVQKGERMLVLMRGLPGSGKSTVAQDVVPGFDGRILSADKFPGLYNNGVFNPALLPAAHQECMRDFLEWLACGYGDEMVMIVDNTNLEVWELAKYIEPAQAYGIRTLVVNVLAEPEQAFARQTHGVPREVFDRMHATMQAARLLPWWPTLDLEQR